MEFFHKKTSYPFMATRKRWYMVSAALILGSLLALGIRGINFGIDFTGGVVLELSFPQAADLEQVRDSLEQAGYGDAVVQSFGTPRDVLVRMLPEEGTDNNVLGRKVLTAIQSENPGVELRRTEVVGGQVGAELAEKGALAVLFTFFFILLYVWARFQWKLGVGAIVAALHDPVIILGFFAATQMTFDLVLDERAGNRKQGEALGDREGTGQFEPGALLRSQVASVVTVRRCAITVEFGDDGTPDGGEIGTRSPGTIDQRQIPLVRSGYNKQNNRKLCTSLSTDVYR